MGATARRITMTITLLLALVLALAACTVDDLDKKKCEPGSKDPELQCLSGYVCHCVPEGCFCEPAAAPVATADPNLELLQRLGAVDGR